MLNDNILRIVREISADTPLSAIVNSVRGQQYVNHINKSHIESDFSVLNKYKFIFQYSFCIYLNISFLLHSITAPHVPLAVAFGTIYFFAETLFPRLV